MKKNLYPKRKTLPHEVPGWVKDDAVFFITINGQPKGFDQFDNEAIFEMMLESLQFRQKKGELALYVLLVMPDHLHGLMSFARDPGMSSTLENIKRYIATEAGIKWQRDYFDHRIRKEESLIEKAHYIRMNPVRKKLVNKVEDWRYVWPRERL